MNDLDQSSNQTAEIIESINESAPSDIKKPFEAAKIDITQKPLIIDSLIKRMRSEPMRIDLNTEFQRMGNLWKEDVQSRLIESLLVRIPLPAFFFDGTDENCWKIVDGLQRIITLKNFIIDKSLKLTGLEYLEEFEGKNFDELPVFLQGRIEETHITAFIINPGTPPDVKYNIFKRINTGGLMLTPQEIRHALNQGIPADFVKELALAAEFRKATGHQLDGCKRMEDRDFVTRFIGFYLGYENYQPDLDSFLNDSMAKLKELSKNQREKIKADFKKAMNAAYNIFGGYAFRKKFQQNGRKNPLNKALFDTWAVNLAKLDDQKIDLLVCRKQDVEKRFILLINSEGSFLKAISSGTGDIKAVQDRFKFIAKLIQETIHDKTD
ncbi:DUF262 domain-containing protein [candidate division KSB1 bacterium]|nr:DUF262 domain-containing protein [candidate division KSB1 bacterium]